MICDRIEVPEQFGTALQFGKFAIIPEKIGMFFTTEPSVKILPALSLRSLTIPPSNARQNQRPGFVISSGRTQRSKSLAETKPD